MESQQYFRHNLHLDLPPQVQDPPSPPLVRPRPRPVKRLPPVQGQENLGTPQSNMSQPPMSTPVVPYFPTTPVHLAPPTYLSPSATSPMNTGLPVAPRVPCVSHEDWYQQPESFPGSVLQITHPGLEQCPCEFPMSSCVVRHFLTIAYQCNYRRIPIQAHQAPGITNSTYTIHVLVDFSTSSHSNTLVDCRTKVVCFLIC